MQNEINKLCIKPVTVPLISRVDLFCDKSIEFINRYIINVVLSYIEEKEQDLILSMRYHDWVIIGERERKEIKDRIVASILRYAKACGLKLIDKNLSDQLKEEIDLKKVVEHALCYLYIYGIYGDCASRYLLLKTDDSLPDFGEGGHNVFEECKKILSKIENIKVRSRFIDIVKDLYNAKQRFPDISLYDSSLLIDRVFAYAHPRLLPVGRYKPSGLLELLQPKLRRFFEVYYKYLLNCSEVDYYKFEIFYNILKGFFDRLEQGEKIKFYEFQRRGLEKALEKLTEMVKSGRIDYLVIEAPTGSGKTEIMVLVILITALARKLILSQTSTPVALIVYPRRALATDQFSRLLKYTKLINDVISNNNLDIKIYISLDFTDIRSRKEINKSLQEVTDCDVEKVPLRLKYGVTMGYLCRDNMVELRSFTCPEDLGGEYPRFRVKERIVDDSMLLCGDVEIDFISATKDRVKERMGDVHITIFETLRRHLRKRRNIFRVNDQSDHPLIIVLDEIHTYVDVPGVRYAFLIRRVINRLRFLKRRSDIPILIIGMSATIPHKSEFLRHFFMDDRINENTINDFVVKVHEEESVPLGNEYFIITVPTKLSPVDALSVSIQTIMTMYYNMPTLPLQRKKAIVFAEELNVLHRLKKKLSDAIKREDEKYRIYGLQDLRNPRHILFEEKTRREIGDDEKLIEEVKRGRISKVSESRSWAFGELWWGYMLDIASGNFSARHNIEEYTSRYRGDVKDADIIIATSSLELGVDYSDVVLIYQHGAPPTISSLVQRAGRAGRRVYENPLTRVVVGVQLSPEKADQSWMFEIFTKTKNMRDALRYDMFHLPIKSSELHKQVLAEVIDEYLNTIEPRQECDLVDDKSLQNSIKNYARWIFSDNLLSVNMDKLLDDIIRYLEEKCNKYE